VRHQHPIWRLHGIRDAEPGQERDPLEVARHDERGLGSRTDPAQQVPDAEQLPEGPKDPEEDEREQGWPGAIDGASLGRAHGPRFRCGPPWLLELNLSSRAAITDRAGNPLANTLLGTVYRVDRVAPTITLAKPASGAVYALGATVSAGFACADELIGAGLATCTGTSASGAPIDTASVGPKTFTVVALDRAGNSATKVVAYTVIYAFIGFLGSIDNPPALNAVKAGSSVPLTFSLAGDRGLAILASGSPSYQAISCTTHALIGLSTPAVGSLAYSSSPGRYTWTWLTSTGWAGTCVQLVLGLDDGTTHIADFRLR